MPVVTEGKTLVGTITRVEDDHAWVTLVTDVDSAVSATSSSRARRGRRLRRLQPAALDGVRRPGRDVKEGDTVVTSGLGGSYPAGPRHRHA